MTNRILILVAAFALTGCSFSPEYGHWIVDGDPGATGCEVFPALLDSWDFLETDDGLELALPSGSSAVPCTLEGREFACEPLTFDWRFSDGEVTSTLEESLTVSGRFGSRTEASGSAVMDLTCQDDDCPNRGACSAQFTFRALVDGWLGLG